MHIGVGLGPSVPGSGVSRYAEKLASALVAEAHGSGDMLTFLTDTSNPRWLLAALTPHGVADPAARACIHHSYWQRRPGTLQTIGNNLLLGPRLSSLRLDVYHGIDVYFAAALGSANVARVMTIHDLAAWRLPQLVSRRSRFFASFVLTRLLPRVDRIIADSHSTARDLGERVPGVAARIRVVHLGVDPRFAPASAQAIEACRRQLGLPSQYLLYLGQLKPEKNLSRLLEAYSILYGRYADTPPLVLAGIPYRGAETILRQARKLHLEQQVLFLGFVLDETLPALLTGAQVFVYPSLYEGFGLPVLEAMACGTPVVTSNCSSLPEVAGETAVLVDPASSEAIADGILCLLDNASRRRRLAEQGLLRARTFRWADTARQTLQVYREAVLCRAS